MQCCDTSSSYLQTEPLPMHSHDGHRQAPGIALHPLAEWLQPEEGEEAHSAWKRRSMSWQELPESQPQSLPGEERESTGERDSNI